MFENYGKRVLSFVMALIMVFSMVPSQVFATEVEEHEHCAVCGQHDCICCDVCGQAECVCPDEESDDHADHEHCAVCGQHDCICCDVCGQAECVCPEENETPTEEENDAVADMNAQIDSFLDYWLVYYGFEMPDEADFIARAEAAQGDDAQMQALAEEWEAVRAEIEDIVANVIPAGELENIVMPIREIEYTMAETLTEEQIEEVLNANPVYVDFAYLVNQYAVVPDPLVDLTGLSDTLSQLGLSYTAATKNGTLTWTASGTGISGSIKNDTTYTNGWSTYYNESQSTLTITNTGKPATLSFTYGASVSKGSVAGWRGTVTIDGTQVAGESSGNESVSGQSFSKAVGTNGTVNIVIFCSAINSSYSTRPNSKVSLSDITLTGTVTFGSGEKGTYTVDGVASTEVASKDGTVKTTTYELVATPDEENYVFLGWFVDGDLVSTSETYTFTNPGNCTILPKYEEPAPLNITFGAAQGGTYTVEGATPPTSAVTAEIGSSYALKATASSGYTFAGWYVEGATAPFATAEEANLSVGSHITADGTVYPKFQQVSVEFDSTLGSVIGSGAWETGNAVTLKATPDTGVTFLAWTDGNGKILSDSTTYAVTVADSTALSAIFMKDGGNAVFALGAMSSQQSYSEKFLGVAGTDFYYYTASNTHLFYDLEDAIAAAKSGSSKVIVPVNNGIITGDYTIPNGVYLLIPYDAANTLNTTNPVCAGEVDVPTATDSITAYRTLTMASGSSITVESGGVINVNAKVFGVGGGDLGGGSPLGSYGYLKMEGNAAITLQSGAALYAYGYIGGSGSVTAQSGSTVYEIFSIETFRGGTVTSAMATDSSLGIFPMNGYSVQNVMVPMTIEAGATEYAYASLYMQKSLHGTAVKFIGPYTEDSSKSAMFSIKSGSVTKDYQESTDRVVVTANAGTVSLSNMTMSISDISLDSINYDLPINGNFTISIGAGSTIELSQDVALLPGAEVYIAEGATCDLKSGYNLFIYDMDQWGTYMGSNNGTMYPTYFVPERQYTRSTSDLKDVYFKVAGQVVVSGNAYTTGVLDDPTTEANEASGGAAITGVEGAKVTLYKGDPDNANHYQMIQTATEYADCTHVLIPLTDARLMNADGSYTDPSKICPTNGTLYTYTSGVWVPECRTIDGVSGCVGDETAKDCEDQLCIYCGQVVREGGEHTEGAAATCTTAQTCTVCGEVLTEALGHSKETIPAVAATCYSTGLTAGVKCNREGCGETLTAQTVTEKIAHTWGSTPTSSVAATCTTAGSNTYSCTVCTQAATNGKIDASAIGTKTETIDALNHDLKLVEGSAASCTAAGAKSYYACQRDNCGAYFEDADGNTPITEAIDTWKVIPATGHQNVTVTAQVDASCKDYGTKAYYYCSDCKTYYATRSTEDEKILSDAIGTTETDLTNWKNGSGRIEKLSHTEENVNEVPATCLAAGTSAGAKCSVCGTILSGCTEIAKKNHVGTLVSGQAATCTADGWYDYYKCNNGCQGYFTTKGEDNVLTGEITDLETWKTTEDQGKIAALGHHLVKVDEVPKTCDTAGTAAHYKCDRENCGLLFKSEEDAQNNTSVSKDALIIEAGHTPAEAVIENKDETTGIYELVVYCSECDYEISRKLMVDGQEVAHTGIVKIDYQAPTCTEKGHQAGWECTAEECPVCQGTAKGGMEEIESLGHTFAGAASGDIAYTFNKTDENNLTATASGKCTRANCGADHSVTVAATMTETERTCVSDQTKTYTASFADIEGLKDTHTETDTIATATGHDWSNEVVYTWGENYATCTATLTCKNNTAGKACVLTETVDTKPVLYNAGCVTNSYTIYTADFQTNQEYFVDQSSDKVENEGTATGHTWGIDPDVPVVWNTETLKYTATLKCTKCEAYYATDGGKVTVDVVRTVNQEDTCTQAGEILYTATFTASADSKDTMPAAQTMTEKPDTVQHKWSTVSYTWAEDYSTCTASRTCTYGCSEEETVSATPGENSATCIAGGAIVYTTEAFKNTDFAVQTKSKPTDPLGHAKGEEIDEDSPTCQKEGVTAHVTCSRCDLLFKSEADLKNNVAASKEVYVADGGLKMPKVGHDYQYTYNNDATCLADGTNTVTCTWCTYEQVETAAGTKLDHKWGDYSYDPGSATCLSDGTKTAKCTYDGCTESNTINAENTRLGHKYEGNVTEAATCTAKGTRELTCVNGCGNSYTEEIDALGHAYNKIKGQAATCYAEGWRDYYQCAGTDESRTYCGLYFANENDTTSIDVDTWKTGAGKLDKIAHVYEDVVTAPTCLKQGYTTHTCKNCPEGTDGHSYVDTYVDATDHAYNSGVITTQPTCTAEGIKTFTCTRDCCTEQTEGHTKTESVEATGHSLVAIIGQDATCVAAGWNAYYQCAEQTQARTTDSRSYCGYYFASATDTAVTATPIATTADELSAWQTKSVEEGGGAIEQLEHVDTDGDHLCDQTGCDDTVSECVDNDKDHYCDLAKCDKKLSDCVDENPKDHYCDYEGCKKQLSTCADANDDNDHLCDYCQATIGDHEYTNGLCNCGYVKDVTVNITIKAENADDQVLTEESIKYKNNAEAFSKTLDLSGYGKCYTIQSVTVMVGGTEVESTYEGNTLTIASELLTDDVVITVNAYQYHVVGTINTTSTPASCGVAGSIVTTITCKNCDTLYSTATQEIPALEHEYSSVYTEPTFDADGYTTYTCKNGCGDSYVVTNEGSKLIAVAMVGSQKFQTLDEAIAAANGRGAIILLTKVVVEGTQVWDLGRASLYIADVQNEQGEDIYGLVIQGDLTIKSGNYIAEGFYGIAVQPAGKLTIEGGSFEVYSDNDYLIGSWGETVINGGSFKGQYCCVDAFDSYDPSVTSKLTITGGTFETAMYDATGKYESSDVFAEDPNTIASITGGTFSKSVADYVAEGYCQVQNSSTSYNVAAHEPLEAVQENVVPATCTTAGSYDSVIYCDRCEEKLSSEPKTIDALGHTVTTVEGSAATCTEDGYEEAYYCSVCEKYFATKISDTELADEIEGELSTWQTEGAGKIDALGHALEKVDAISATCEGTGVKEYWQCSRCPAAFEDEAEETAISDLTAWKAEGGNGYIGALGHSYTSEVTTAPTCTDTGVRTYTCQNDTSHTYTESIDALGHKYKVEYTWNDDLTVCTASAVCENNANHKATMNAVVNVSVTTAAECENAGAGIRTAKFSSNIYGIVDQSEDVVIPATGHSFTKYMADGNATCTEDGTKTASCDNNCGKTDTVADTGSAKGHTEVLVLKVDATCENKGNIEHYRCTTCWNRFYDKACTQPIAANEYEIAALEHDYTEVVTAPTCETKGYTTYTCSRGDHTYVSDYVDALGHEWNDGVILEGDEATCTADGTKTFTCVRGCTKTETVAATGHATGTDGMDGYVQTIPSTCETAGSRYYYQCQNSCGLFYEDKECTQLIGDADDLLEWQTNGAGKIDQLGHNPTTYVSGKANDCDDAGYLASYQCTRCNLFFSVEGENKVMIGDGSQDAWNAWALDEKGAGYLAPKDHTPGEAYTDEKSVTKPSCTEDGSHDVVTKCTVCGVETSRDTVVDSKTGHVNLTAKAGKDATCTETGYEAYWQCECDALFSDKDAINSITAPIVIPSKGHTEVVLDAVDATCTEPGKKEGLYCSACSITLVAQEEIAAKGHNHNVTISTEPAKCTVDGKQILKCERCEDTITEILPQTGHNSNGVLNAVDPTCTATGLTAGKECTVCGYDTEPQEVVPALGHKIVETAAVAAKCDAYGTEAYYYCETCEKYFATKVSETELADEITNLATWLDTVGQGKIEKLPHTNEVIPAVAPTCTEDGLKAGVECSVCGATLVEQEVDPAKGHNSVTDKAVEPDCVKTGLTEGSHCSVCQEVLVKQEVVDALGHTEEIRDAVAPTCTKTGLTEGKYCTVCKTWTVAQTTVPMLGHSEETLEAVAATCDKTGLTEGKYCPVCDTTTVPQDEIPALGHTETILAKQDPTCTETGLTEGKKCSVCDAILVEQETVPAPGHTATLFPGQKAKCELAGWKDSYQCSTCKKYFEDEKCENLIEDMVAWRTGDGMIAGLEHVWDEGRITTLPTCTEDGVKTFTCSTCNGTKTDVEPMLGHDAVQHAGQHPTYYSAGWNAYETCTRCEYTTMTGIPALGEPSVGTFEEFMTSLKLLEEYANAYVKANPGKDPMLLLIKYVRTGVDRYNSGSWQIMAGYEDEAFAEYVKAQEETYNKAVATVDEMINVTGIKNIAGFELPNGQTVDFGHMFGTMDITYHNKTSINHADVAGWAGDLVDLLDTADRHGVTGTVDEMIKEIGENYLNHSIEGESDQFSQTDMYGDLDGYYFMKKIIGTDYEAGMLYDLMEAYFTESLTDEQRADFFLKNRLGGVTGRNEIREAVFSEYLGNSMIATLEDTRNFVNEDVSDLRKASCYAFADYLCYLAGDYVELGDNPYFSVFSTELSTLAPGITQQISKATTADGKQVVYYTATADVNSPYVHVYANYKDNDPSLGWGMQRVLDQANAAQAKYGDPESELYIENYNVIAAINGAGYNMTTGEPAGVLMMNGVEYHAPDGNGFVGILKDGTATMGTTEQYYELKETGLLSEAIAIFGTKLIEDGKINITANSSYYNDRASRTAFGITKTGKVVFMVMDGRQEPVSCGGSMIEIAQVMLEAGCVFAVNLDGGGSTTYVARQEGDSELSLVSSPSDGFQRSVSTSWMMVSTAPSSTAFDHAVLDSDVRHLTIGATTQVTASGVSATGNSVELPEGTTWAVSDASIASITEDGLVTALANGTVDVRLMLGDEIVGTRTLNVVIPDAVYFTKENMNAVYGEPKELPVAALYEGKPVAIVEADVYFTLSNESAGTTEGFNFIGNEESGIKAVKIYAHAVNNPDATSGSMGINLFRADEASFDFENADGGDRMLAWNRVVSNSTTADKVTYTVVDKAQSMVTEYTFAMDMTQIPMPDKLTDLVYMLPGADVDGNNSAWDFLLQLAERVSVLTEVKAVLRLDPNFDVDYSGLTVNCEYFNLETVELNSETNELTLSLRWKDQTKAIDPDTANPLVILTGFKLTPKADAAWDAKERLTVINTGEISYDIYLRANALYSFASKPENQAAYDLYPFVNPDVTVGGSPESGGHFADTYKTFSDEYTLNKGMKNGWVYEDGGYAYYEDDVKYTGIRKVGQFYYDFGESGINMGQTKYTGMFQIDGINHYSKEGVLSGGWYIDKENNKYYFDETGKAVDGEFVIDEVEMIFENGLLIGGHTGFLTKTSGNTYYYQNGSMYYGWLEMDGKWYCFDETNGIMTVGDGTNESKLFPTQEAKAKGAYYVFNEQGHALYSFPNNFGYYYWADLQAQNKWVRNGYDLDGWYRTNANAHYVTTSDANQLFELTLDGKTYNAVKIAVDGVVYTFDNSNGKLLLGSLVLTEGKWYYYWAGEPVNDGWFDFNGETYYAFEDGHLATGSQTIDGESYMFTSQGALIKNGTTLSITMSDDFAQMTIKTSEIKDVNRVMMGVWSEASGQADMSWFEATVDANGIWTAIVHMCLYENTGVYQIHAYEFDENGAPVKLLVNTTYEVTKAGVHTAGETEKQNVVAPTCTQDGGYDLVAKCVICDEIAINEHVVEPATGHTAGEAKKENVAEATCTEDGGYDLVTRCKTCNEVLKSESKVESATGHKDEDNNYECDVCGEPEEIETIAMLRLYNPNSGEHFYTGSVEEKDMLVAAGWHYEGVAWNAPTKIGAPIYRLFNPNSGDHHYTGSADERDMLVELGWNYEGVAWNTMVIPNNYPQFRMFNPNAEIGSHHYTGSTEERDYLVSLGWHYEGIGWYGCAK